MIVSTTICSSSAADLSPYDAARLPVWMDGNVFLKGAKPSKHEKDPLRKPEFDPAIRLVEKADGFHLEITLDKAWAAQRTRQLVTTDLLGKAAIPNLPYERPDGTPLADHHRLFRPEKERSQSNARAVRASRPGQARSEGLVTEDPGTAVSQPNTFAPGPAAYIPDPNEPEVYADEQLQKFPEPLRSIIEMYQEGLHRNDWAALLEGCYLLRTNLNQTNPATLSRRYIQSADAEWALGLPRTS